MSPTINFGKEVQCGCTVEEAESLVMNVYQSLSQLSYNADKRTQKNTDITDTPQIHHLITFQA